MPALIAAALLAAALVGCAAPPRAMTWLATPTAAGTTWPAPPDPARYAYVGELVGERNFVTPGASTSGGAHFVRWLVGLGATAPEVRALSRPQSGTVTPDGRILVTDVGNAAVFAFDPTHARLELWTRADRGAAFAAPIGITNGRDGEILVADAQLARIVRLDADGRPRGSFGTGILVRPTGLARDPAGRVFVADTGANDLKMFADDGSLLRTIGVRGTSAGEFNGPTHLAWADERLYVADTLNARVQVLDGSGQALGVIGRRGLYVGNLTRPKGIAVLHGNVHVIESYFDHLLVFDGAGRFLLPIGGAGTAPGQFQLPAGAWTDGGERLFVADMYNGRIAVFRYLGGDA